MAGSPRVQIVDPPAFTPPYDRSLAAALARAGADVDLVTSRFSYGRVPPAHGYRVDELFYRRSARLAAGGRVRTGARLAEHVPDMLRHRRHAARADLVHYQWLTVQPLDVHLLASGRPRVLTAHDVLPREPRPGQLRGTRRLLERMDAVVAHSRDGATRLQTEVGLDPERIRVIPHGAFDYLTRQHDERPLPDPLAAVTRPVVLFFGLLRPYKGLDVLLDAFAGVPDAELWIVGRPRMQLAPLKAAAPPRVRFVPRFVVDCELPAYFRRADVVVLPYRQIEQSGVLATALAFGKPVVASSVGGFPEVAATGALRLVPPGDRGALAAALRELLEDPGERARLAEAALAAARGPYSWERAAVLTIALYRELLAR